MKEDNNEKEIIWETLKEKFTKEFVIKGKDIRIYTVISAKFMINFAKIDDNLKNRDIFCELVYSILAPEFKEKITIEELKSTENKILISIGKEFTKSDEDLKNYMKDLTENNNYFNRFISGLEKIKKRDHEKLIETLKPLHSYIHRSLNKKFEEIRKMFNKSTKDMFENLGDVLRESLRQVTKVVEEHGEKYNKIPLILFQLGWPPFKKIPVIMMDYIIKEFEEKEISEVKKEVDELITDYYEENKIINIAKSWRKNKELNNRIHILNSVIEAHIEEKYNLSIPAILPQIEGVIAESFCHEGRMYGKKLKNYIDLLLEDNYVNSFDESINSYIKRVVLVSFEHGKPINSNLSRHAILHGADIKYGTKINSLKAILLFNYIQDSLN